MSAPPSLQSPPLTLSATTSSSKSGVIGEGLYSIRNLSLSADGVYVRAGAQAALTAATTDHHLGAGQSVDTYLAGTVNGLAVICPTSTATVQVMRKGTTWVPGNISGLVAWYDADQRVTLNGANVSAWADLSPKGGSLAQAVAGNQPKSQASAFGALSSVRPNDANDSLSDAAKPDLSSLAGVTMFVVFKLASTSGTQVIVDSPAGKPHGVHKVDTSELYAMHNATIYGKVAFTSTAATIAESLYDGTASGDANRLKLYVDGTAQTLAFTGTVGATTDAASTGLNVGHATTSFSGGDVAAILIYNRTLDATDRGVIGRWLGARYGITTAY